jgi:hypothetical protein
MLTQILGGLLIITGILGIASCLSCIESSFLVLICWDRIAWLDKETTAQKKGKEQ